MELELLRALPIPLAIAGILLTLYNLYYLVVALFGLKKPEPLKETPPETRFALLVAARNEETVIGQLCDSLNNLNYPKELYKVIVAPNNCTDSTRETALAHGADVFCHEGKVSSKGEVLTQLVDKILNENQFDAVCVFDADNLVHPDFLLRMNDAVQAGAQVAQGFRDSKNPADTPVSTAGSAWYWMLSRFYNGGREALGLSALINGSGFMVTSAFLRQLGGWRTLTITEDYEFTARCVLAGERVAYVPSAIIYDEQPLLFWETVKQRRRWCTGGVQGAKLFFGKLAWQGLRSRSPVTLDLALTYLMPWLQSPALLCWAATAGWLVYQAVAGGALYLLWMLLVGAGTVFLAWAGAAVLAAFMMKLTRGKLLPRTLAGICFFPLYVLSWMPIAIYSLFFKKKSWEPISHTRALGLGQMGKTA